MKLILVAAAAACLAASCAPGRTAADSRADPCCAERQDLESAVASLGINDFKAADETLRRVLGSPKFDTLESGKRHQALLLAGLAAFQLRDFPRAHGLLIRSSAMGEANGMDWRFRLMAASARKDAADSILAATTMFGLIREANKLPPSDVRKLDLLEALYTANWKVQGRFEPSDLWSDLSLLLLARGRIDRAREVAARVTEPYALIGMRADDRFAAVTAAGFLPADIKKAALRMIDEAREAALASPRLLKPLHILTFYMLKSRQYQEVLAMTDDVLARAAAASGGKAAYEDKSELIWIMDHRARALQGRDRWDEAVDQLTRAARRPEEGDINVSQKINLAALLLDMGRPKEALAAISELGELAPYGRMQVESVHHQAGLELKDRKMADEAMRYLQEHMDDAPETYEVELVRAGDLDAAAARVIARLADPERRTQTLVELQEYEERPAPPAVLEQRARWRSVHARADVRAAVAKVGRIEHYDLEPFH